ncbi:MAG TPA: RNA methyltransferase [Bacteroidales bacterium]|nr:RNA methyltransferase [Bacteroidales bacterium]
MRKLSIEELNRLSTGEFKKAEKNPVYVVLDNIRSLNNIGSVFRTCDAFRIRKIFLCGITAVPPHKDIHKTALGATESVDWEYADDTLTVVQKLHEAGIRILSVEQADRSTMLQDITIEPGSGIALVFGHEVRGVDQAVIDASDDCIEIPQFGTKHSFNVSVSAGIVLWEVTKKMGF